MSGVFHRGTRRVPAPTHTESLVSSPPGSVASHEVHTPTRGVAIRVAYRTIATVMSTCCGWVARADEMENARGCTQRMVVDEERRLRDENEKQTNNLHTNRRDHPLSLSLSLCFFFLSLSLSLCPIKI